MTLAKRLCLSFIIFVSTSYAFAESIHEKSTSSAKDLRLQSSQVLRDLPGASRLKLGQIKPENSLLDSYPPFQENIRALFDLPAGTRVLGGAFATRYSDVVGIFPNIPKNGLPNNLCTGVLISPVAVVTAAHCACDRVARYVQFGSVISSDNASFEVGDTTVFPGIDCATYLKENAIQKTKTLMGKDFAVLKLKKEVSQDIAMPRRIADSSIVSDWDKISIRVVGFGLDDTGKYGQKMHADVPIASAACSISASTIFQCAPKLELVAQSKNFLSDTCNGDSGGPAFIYDRKSDHFYLHGITSRGLPGQPCGHGGVYGLASSESAINFLSQHASIGIGRLSK